MSEERSRITVVKCNGQFNNFMGTRSSLDDRIEQEPRDSDFVDVDTGMFAMIQAYKDLCDQIPEDRHANSYPCEDHFNALCAIAYECKYAGRVFEGRNDMFHFLMQYVFKGTANPVTVRNLVQEIYELPEICREPVYNDIQTS